VSICCQGFEVYRRIWTLYHSALLVSFASFSIVFYTFNLVICIARSSSCVMIIHQNWTTLVKRCSFVGFQSVHRKVHSVFFCAWLSSYILHIKVWCLAKICSCVCFTSTVNFLKSMNVTYIGAWNYWHCSKTISSVYIWSIKEVFFQKLKFLEQDQNSKKKALL
jgi:hypothetical protein